MQHPQKQAGLLSEVKGEEALYRIIILAALMLSVVGGLALMLGSSPVGRSDRG